MIITGICCNVCSCYFTQEALEPSDVTATCPTCAERIAEAEGELYCSHCHCDVEEEKELDRYGMCADCSADYYREFWADHQEAA